MLGSADHGRFVTSHAWDALPVWLNVTDFDIVILNLTPFLADPDLVKRVDAKRLPAWEQFARLLFSENSEIIAIGWAEVAPIGRLGFVMSDWLPHVPVFQLEPGESIRNVAPEYKFYFRHVRRWAYSRR